MKYSFAIIITMIISLSCLNGQNLQISGGNNFSSVVCNQQVVNVSGYNKDGQLGTDAAGNPIALGTFRSGWAAVSRGTLGATPLNTGPDVMPAIRQADAGSGGHLLGLDCAKNVWAWGLNDQGQLGRNNSGVLVSNSVPMRVLRGAQSGAGLFLSNISYVSGGNNSSFAIEEGTGRVLAWGANDYGQLGDGTTISRTTPVYVLTGPGVQLTNIVQIEAGDDCSYALDANGNVWSWGITHDGAFVAYNLGRTRTGEVAAAGGGGRLCIPYAGRVLRGTNNNDDPANTGFLDNIVSLSGGDAHGLALDANGGVWSWGGDWGTGQLGQGNGGQYSDKAGRVVDVGVTAATGPFLGSASSLYEAISIAAGQSSSAIVIRAKATPTNLATNRVVAFGSNGLYESGTLITQSGSIVCTGNNQFYSGTIGRGVCGSASCNGQAPQNTNNNTRGYEYPVFVETAAGVPLANVTTVSDGDAWYFATNDVGGNAVSWGWNRRGEQAEGTFTDRCYASSLTLPTSCAFDYPCPGQPVLPADFTTCPVFSQVLNSQIAQTYATYRYNWQYRATPGSGPWIDITGQGTTSGAQKTTIVTSTNNTTYTASQAGEFRVLVSDNRTSVAFLCAPCPVEKDSITISLVPNPYVTGGCSGTPNSEYSITTPANAKIKWYTTLTGGTALNPSDSIPTISVPNASVSTSAACGGGLALFAEDVQSVQGTTIRTGALTPTPAQIATATGCATGSWGSTGGDQNEMMIELSQTARINSISIIISAGYNINTTKDLQIFNNNPTGQWCGSCSPAGNKDGRGTQLAFSPINFPVSYVGGSGNQIITIPINQTLAAGRYWFKLNSFNEVASFNCNRTKAASPNDHLWQTPYDDDVPVSTVLQVRTNFRSGNYDGSGSFFDLKFETGTGYSCGRILVCRQSTSCPLPVDLIYFTATKQGNDALLTWATSSEQNSDRFEVKRSLDGITWATIGIVKSVGNSSSVSEYSYIDENMPSGTVYYMLHQVDFDGKSDDSNIEKIENGTSLSLSASPNPNNGTFTVSINSVEANTSIRLINTLGQTVYEGTTNTKGVFSKEYNFSYLAKGVYQLEARTSSEHKLIRLVLE